MMKARKRQNSKKVRLLKLIEERTRRGGKCVADREGAPPSHMFRPLEKAGLARRERHQYTRSGSFGNYPLRWNVWLLTPKGEELLASVRPQVKEQRVMPRWCRCCGKNIALVDHHA